MTHLPIQKNPLEIERLPADFAGFCCENRNCPECLRAYRKGLAFMRQERAARRKLRQSHKPTLTSLLKQADKAGKSVKGAEVYPDRTVLQFGEPSAEATINEWDETLRRDKH
jgi:hypothetical protein